METGNTQYKFIVFRPSVCPSVTNRYYQTVRLNVTRIESRTKRCAIAKGLSLCDVKDVV